MRKWRVKNPEKSRLMVKLYRQTEKGQEVHRMSNRKWARKFKDKIKIYQRQWAQTERGKFFRSLKYARRKNAEGSYTLNEWKRLKEKYNSTCPMCGEREPKIKLTRDHIIPLIKNGTNYISNIQPLCGSCNSAKHDKILN